MNTQDPMIQYKSQYKLASDLEENIKTFSQIFRDNETLVIRRFQNKSLPEVRCSILYLDGMAKSENIQQSIIEPVLNYSFEKNSAPTNQLEELQNKAITMGNVELLTDIGPLIIKLIEGNTLFFLEGYKKVLSISTQGWKSRSISEPESAKVVRGPREGFTEAILDNLSMIQRRIKSPDLKLRYMRIGTKTITKTCVCYIEGVALDCILQELIQRLNKIDIDAILDSGYIQELIRDEPFSPFETVGYSERPDVVVSKLLEGRIAIVVDGSPFVLTVPFVLAESAQASEDYYNNYLFASFNRMIRSVGAIACVSIPALYLAVVTYHQEFIPTPLLLTISASREGVPFPTFLSIFIMLIIFDILREAGTRMPTSIGQAINIVGSLVLGQAAVEAKLVSAPIVIITAITGILTLLNTSMIGSIVIIRFFLLLTSSVMGIYGFILGFFITILHLVNMRSFGIPYLLNLTSVKNHNGQDIWIRAPWWSMTLRPKLIGIKNLVRQRKK